MSIWLSNSPTENLQCHPLSSKNILNISDHSENPWLHFQSHLSFIYSRHSELLSLSPDGPCSSLPFPILLPLSGIFAPPPSLFNELLWDLHVLCLAASFSRRLPLSALVILSHGSAATYHFLIMYCQRLFTSHSPWLLQQHLPSEGASLTSARRRAWISLPLHTMWIYFISLWVCLK